MGRIALTDARVSLHNLLQTGRLEVAKHLLQTLTAQAQTHLQAEEVAGILAELPETLLTQEPLLQRLYATVLCRSRNAKALLQFLDSLPSSGLQTFRAWALLRTDQLEAALECLTTPPNPEDLGLYWRCKGEALFRTEDSAWTQAYQQARGYLHGPALGRSLLDEGHLLERSGQRAAARVLWSEALGHLREDLLYLAWARHSLGISLVKDRPEEAEHHLLEAVRLSHSQVAQEFQARALCGLASLRRSLGEWPRALYTYQQALQAPGDLEDRQQATWGYAHTLRLLGQTEEALAELIVAQQIRPQRAEWLNADIAAARLMLGDEIGARAALDLVQAQGERSQCVGRLLRAVLLHRQGQTEAAKTAIGDQDPNNLWVREEAYCFPELRAYIALPEALGQTACWVEVNPFGSLEVRVNGRTVPLSPTGRPGELLVCLLENGGSANDEMLLEALYEGKKPKGRKALWGIAEKLRHALGWAGSVQLQGRVYRLDPSASWRYLEQPKPGGSAVFLLGHYRNWVQERRGVM